jgi:hypothetical protein
MIKMFEVIKMSTNKKVFPINLGRRAVRQTNSSPMTVAIPPIFQNILGEEKSIVAMDIFVNEDFSLTLRPVINVQESKGEKNHENT